jgi:hypothetical protein
LRPSDDRSYVIRTESLDTGEVVEEFLGLRIEKIKEKLRNVVDSRKMTVARPSLTKLFPTFKRLF